MTPEIDLIEDYNKWLGQFRASSDVADRQKLEAGLSAYITAETILIEPSSVPWGGRLVGYDGWATFIKEISPIVGPLSSRFRVSSPVYYQKSEIVLREYSVTISDKAGATSAIVLNFIEKYTVMGARIVRIDEYYSDTAALLDFLRGEGLLGEQASPHWESMFG